MKQYCMLPSETYVQKAVEVLGRLGIRATGVRVPLRFAAMGCGAGLVMEMGDRERLLDLFAAHRIPVRRVVGEEEWTKS